MLSVFDNFTFTNFTKKISESESDLLLKNMALYSLSGQSMKSVLEALAEKESAKIQKILSEIKTLHTVRQEPIANILLRYGIIKDKEFKILDDSDDFSEAINLILEMRVSSDKLKNLFLDITRIPVNAIIVTLIAGAFSFPILADFIRSVASKFPKKDIHIIWIVNQPQYLLYVAIAIAVIYYGFIFAYRFYEKNELRQIYKFFPLKAYEDLPSIFKTMQLYMDRGANDVFITRELSRYAEPKGIREMFENGKNGLYLNISERMKRFNIPYDIVSIYETAEATDSLSVPEKAFRSILRKGVYLSPLQWLDEYCNELIDTEIEFLKDKKWGMGLKKIFTYSAYMVFVGLIVIAYVSLTTALNGLR